jgi:hypothetical protein
METFQDQPTQLNDKPKREMTFGEKLVGLTFNPSGDEKVNRAKKLCAELADLITEVNDSQESSYLSNTFYGGAIRRILDAQMYSVKFLTNKY